MIDWFISLIENNRKFILTVFVIFLLIAIKSVFEMPKQLLPPISRNFSHIDIYDTNQPASESVNNIIIPLENKLENLKNLKKISSSSYPDTASISLYFDNKADMKEAIDSIKKSVESLGLYDKYTVNIMDGNDIGGAHIPILYLIIKSYGDEKELKNYIEKLREAITSSYGISNAKVESNNSKIQITLDPAKVEKYDINPLNIKLNHKENNELNVGMIGGQNVSIKLKKRNDVEKIKEIPVGVVNKNIIRIKDIATVEEISDQSNDQIIGDKISQISVFTTSDYDLTKVGKKLKETINSIPKPEGLSVQIYSDKLGLVNLIANNMFNTIINTTLSIILVMSLFIGFSHGLTASIIIPATIVPAFFVMNNLDYTINMFTLVAAILSIGIIIDNSILVVEEAFQNQQEGQKIPNSYRNSVKTVYSSIISSCLTTIVSFFAVAFGIKNEMYYISNTIIITLTISMIVSLTLIPILGAMIDKKFKGDKKKTLFIDKYFDIIDKKYKNFIETTCSSSKKCKRVIALSFGLCFLLPIIYFGSIDIEARKEYDEQQKTIYIEGTDVYDSGKKINIISSIKDKINKKFANDISLIIPSISGAGKTDIGEIKVVLHESWDLDRKSSEIFADIINTIDTLEEKEIKEISYEKNNETKLNKKNEKIAHELLAISSDDLNKIRITSKKVSDYIYDNKIGYDVSSNSLISKNGIILELNDDSIKNNIDEGKIFSHLKLAGDGLYVDKYYTNKINNTYKNVIMSYPEDYYGEKAQIANLKIPSNSGLMPIENVVEIEDYNAINSMKREQKKFIEWLSFRKISDKNIDEIYKDIIEQNPELKSTLFTQEKYKSQFVSDEEDEGKYILHVALIGLSGIFLILLAQFNSFYQPGIILTSILFSTTGITLGYVLTWTTPTMSTLGIAFIILSGIVVNDNIVLVSTYNTVRKEIKDPVEALIITGRKRLKPVILTSLTTIIGLLPSAMNLNINFTSGQIIYNSPNNEFMHDISIPIIFGISFDTIVTLIITPVLLITCYRISEWFKNRNKLAK